MDEVIFQGSVKRRPINLADVSLVFDNSDGVLPISYHEVVLMRRISRSGQSDYLINQSEVPPVVGARRGTPLPVRGGSGHRPLPGPQGEH
jgi:hypothetical protein